MKGIKIEERINIYSRLVSGKVYTNKDLTDIALKYYPDRSAGVISTHMGSDMVADGMLYRVSRSQYVRNDLYRNNPQVETIRATINGQQIIMNADPLEGYTDKQLADELRRRGYEVEARKVTNI
jgi:hypothetical protein